MSDDCFLPLDLPPVSRKKVSASFDGGAISNDSDLLLREANSQSKGHLDSIELLDEERCVEGAVARRPCQMTTNVAPSSNDGYPVGVVIELFN